MSPPSIEIPPTAGLPLLAGDLLPGGGDLAAALARFLGIATTGVECSGTAALIVILTTLRRRKFRRKVIVPAYTCPLVVFAVAHCGLQTVVCDLAPGSFDFDLEHLEQLCDADTLAVLPTHLGGRVAAVAPVCAIAARHGAYVVEDGAQALGARQDGQSVGLVGDAGFFSLAAGKGLTLFEGGVWVSRDPELRAELARTSAELMPTRPLREAWRCLQLLGYAALYRPRGLPLVYGRPLRQALARGDVIVACGDDFSPEIPLHRVSRWRQYVGVHALRRLPEFQKALQAQAAVRLPQLAALPGVGVIGDDAPGAQGVWPFFMLLLPDAARRDAALARLWGAGLGVSRLFALALPDYGYLRPWLPVAAVPQARDFAARSLMLSNSPWLDEARFARIVAELTAVCG